MGEGTGLARPGAGEDKHRPLDGAGRLALLGGGLVEQLLKAILPYAPTGRLVIISPILAGGALVGAVVLGLVAGIYPAARAAGMRPVDAIRSAE